VRGVAEEGGGVVRIASAEKGAGGGVEGGVEGGVAAIM
jgi:hypothetical protein